mmetsp:Transcript_59671/g.172232  ORF Transcript_59671/g.172232 Transcript_59671/m.172232 type:complete len:213 (+) Transcript_59671:342-980(+)
MPQIDQRLSAAAPARESVRTALNLLGIALRVPPPPAEPLGQRCVGGAAPRGGRHIRRTPRLGGHLNAGGRLILEGPSLKEEFQHAGRRRGIHELLHASTCIVLGDQLVRGGLGRIRDGRPPVPPVREKLQRVPDAHATARGHRVVLPVVPRGRRVERLNRHADPLWPKRHGRALQAIQAAVVEREPMLAWKLLAAEVPLMPSDDLDRSEWGI